MPFNSYIFLLLFLPVCLVGYFSLNRFRHYRLAQAFLLGMSFWFCGYLNPVYPLITFASICGNYLFVLAMEKTENPRLRKWEMIAAVALNVCALLYCKYFNFFLSTLNRLAAADFTLREIILPLGISFFTFQQIAYVVTVYRGEAPRYPFLYYAGFVAFFPQMMAGPIVTHDELIPQFLDEKKKAFNWDNFARGLYLFVLGLSKKVLIADVFGNAVDWGFGNLRGIGTTNAILITLAYTIQIYFDFSGYSDMTIGLSRMLNIELPVNFDSPYLSLTITEFWKRWHKTLTRFLTKYVYIPLGGNRKGTLRTYVNIIIVFLVSGLWHGARNTFLLWGLLHGCFQVATRHFKGFFEKLHPAAGWLTTFLFVNLTFALFRADSIGDAITLLGQLVVCEFTPVSKNILSAFLTPEVTLLLDYVPFLHYFVTYNTALLWIFFGGAMALMLKKRNAYDYAASFRPTVWNLLAICALLTLCILSFASVSTFLYADF